MIFIKIPLHLFGILVLTVLSQLGGIAYLFAALLPRASKRRRLGVFLLAYAGLWFAASLFAPMFGRVPLPCGSTKGEVLRVQSPLYCVLNRHYVSPDLKDVAFALAEHVDETHPGTVTLTLDANFPFFDGFALLPHLSHDDGTKLDIAFYYSKNGKTKSPIGYWAFEGPRSGDYQPCIDAPSPTLRWNMRWFRFTHNDIEFDTDRTRTALRWLAGEGQRRGVSKVFVEPHLAQRLGVAGNVIRFQGCRAARHDDHIHIQTR